MVGGTVRKRPGNGIEMVHKYCPTESRNTVRDCTGLGSGRKGFAALHTRRHPIHQDSTTVSYKEYEQQR